MNDHATKPWCQTEEDPKADLSESAARTQPAGQPEMNHRRDAGATDDVEPLPGNISDWAGWLTQRVAAFWVVIPLALAAGWIVWIGIIHTSAESNIPSSQLIGVVGLIVLSMAILVISHYSRRNAISRMVRVIQHQAVGSQGPSGSHDILNEFQPIWAGIEQHTANLQQRVGELVENQRQSMLEITLAETRRRQAVAIINAIADPYIVTDAFDQLIQTNTAAEEVFGFALKDKYREPIGDVVTDERLLQLIHQVREADHRSSERHGEHDLGGKVFASTVAPLVICNDDKDGDAPDHGVVIVLRDITRERSASKNKSEFVSHVAHELRTPLSSICAYVEMLVDGEAADDKTRREFYEIIQSSADRLGRLIDNMLDISRIEAGTVRINKEPIAVTLVVKEAVDMMRPSAEEKKITLSCHVTPVMYRILADRDLIYQAVLNLLSNAIKYTPEEGQVSVRMTPHEETQSMLIEVSDTGVGIPKDDLPRMFEKFFRVKANKDVAKGTGLGLNLVKNIVETVHGGKMTLKSKVGRGSTFGMMLPLMS